MASVGLNENLETFEWLEKNNQSNLKTRKIMITSLICRVIDVYIYKD